MTSGSEIDEMPELEGQETFCRESDLSLEPGTSSSTNQIAVLAIYISRRNLYFNQ